MAIEPAPTLTTYINPSSGPAAGDIWVTITGTGFNDVSAVDFGADNPATTFNVASGTSIAALAPAGTGTVDVTVIAAGGTSATSPYDVFTYVPTVSAISPSAGPLGGNTLVTITGTGFTPGTAVDFGMNNPATNITVVSATTITATSPQGTGTLDVTVTTLSGTSAASTADVFRYAPPPSVAGLSPMEGPLAGGTLVTITGTGFAGATAVYFGTSPATDVTVLSDTTITAGSPAGAGSQPVSVISPGSPPSQSGTSSSPPPPDFGYEPAPTLTTSINPSSGPAAGGIWVTITGTGFNDVSAVDFGADNPATTFNVANGTSIAALAPAGTGTVDVTVIAAGGTSATSPYDVFTYAPTVSAISPSAGPLGGNTLVTITGTGFTPGTAVDFGMNNPATNVTVVSATTITASSPSGTGAVAVTVRTPNPADQTSADSPGAVFTYAPLPTVTGLSPTEGPLAGGTLVTITGTGFTGATAVEFGSSLAADVTVVNDTTITAESPPGTGSQPVSVITPGTQPNQSGAAEFNPPSGISLRARAIGFGAKRGQLNAKWRSDQRRHDGHDFGNELHRRHRG